MTFDHRLDVIDATSSAVAARPAPGKAARTDLIQRRERSTPDGQRVGDTVAGTGTRLAASDLNARVGDAFSLHLPIQAKGQHTAPDGAEPHVAAASGVQGVGGVLPHLSTIQRAFGEHDVTGVVAHVGGLAANAAAQLGAEAYATGNHVAFARDPDLHTAAHEAAHVVQQRAGVHLYGGIGSAGDVYERHADAVADAVVRGESAAALLDVHAVSASSTAPAIQRKPRDENEGRGLAHLRPRQPEASKSRDPGFATLPASAGLKIQEFSTGNLLTHVMSLGSTIPPQVLVELSRGWKERLESGHASHSVTNGQEEAEVKVGYKNAVARGGGEYYADLTWRLAVIRLDEGHYPSAASQVKAPGQQDDTERVRVEDGGRIVFKTSAAVDVVTGPSARRPDALRLDPTEGRGHDQGRITCDTAGAPDEQCFLQPDERATAIENIKRRVQSAQQSFIRACDARRAAIKAAYDADNEFTKSLVEFALGFGLSWAMKAGGKKLAGAIAGKAPDPSPLQPEELGTLVDRQGQHTFVKTKGADAITAAGMKALDMGDAKALMVDALKPGLGSEDRLIAAIKQGADRAFTQVGDTVANHTDAELFALQQAFDAASEGGYQAQLGEFLAKYGSQVATIGEYDAPYAQDFEERVVWLRDPSTQRRRLARMRRDIPNRLDGAGPVKHPRDPAFLGWVDEDMVPFALDRNNRLFGAVEDLSAGAKP